MSTYVTNGCLRTLLLPIYLLCFPNGATRHPRLLPPRKKVRIINDTTTSTREALILRPRPRSKSVETSQCKIRFSEDVQPRKRLVDLWDAPVRNTQN